MAETALTARDFLVAIQQRLNDVIHLLVSEVGSPLPYDVVFPAWLDIESEFGDPIALDPKMDNTVREFVRKLEWT
jgi:hypothetical protein